MRVKEYTAESILKFGLFKGKMLSEIVTLKPDYIIWCAIHLDHFYISQDTMDNLTEINSEFIVDDQMLEILEDKSNRVYRREYVERPSYGKYAGSYAQDYEGLSDNFIDDVLDGFEDAYWNID